MSIKITSKKDPSRFGWILPAFYPENETPDCSDYNSIKRRYASDKLDVKEDTYSFKIYSKTCGPILELPLASYDYEMLSYGEVKYWNKCGPNGTYGCIVRKEII